MHEYPVPQWERVPGKGEGVYRRRAMRFPYVFLWGAGEDPADCHILWSAIILVLVLLPFAVNVGVSPRFAVFC